MSRSDTGKTSRLVIFLRFFIVSTLLIYVPFIWFVDSVTGMGSKNDKFDAYWLWFLMWFGICCFYIGVHMWWMRFYLDIINSNLGSYWHWKAAGGDPYFDHIGWPFNPDPLRVRYAIGTPPNFDWCPNCIAPSNLNYGNQCCVCGQFWDGWIIPNGQEQRQE